MTRAQQIQVVKRLRELEAALTSVDYRRQPNGDPEDDRRSPPYIIGKCKSIVDSALSAAGETPKGKS